MAEAVADMDIGIVTEAGDGLLARNPLSEPASIIESWLLLTGPKRYVVAADDMVDKVPLAVIGEGIVSAINTCGKYIRFQDGRQDLARMAVWARAVAEGKDILAHAQSTVIYAELSACEGRVRVCLEG